MWSERLKIHLYLPPEHVHDALCDRYKHILKTIDHNEHEKRTYIQLKDEFEVLRELPYATIDGKPKSFDNFWKEVIGEKKLDIGEEEDGD